MLVARLAAPLWHKNARTQIAGCNMKRAKVQALGVLITLLTVSCVSGATAAPARRPGAPQPKQGKDEPPAPVRAKTAKPSGTGGQTSSSTTSAANSSGPKAIKDHYLDIGPLMVKLQEKISKNWHPPKDPKTVVVKWNILPSGNVTALRIDKSSGDPACDKAALDSVALSAPFDPLPEGVDTTPIQFTFQQIIRSGMDQIPVSERAASVSLSNSAVDLVKNKNFEEALDKLDFAFERDPRNAHISSVLRAVSAYVSDETPEKVHVLQRVLAMDPQQHAAIEKLRILHRAAGVDPNSANQRMELGNACLSRGDAEGALAEFSAANSIKAGSCSQEKMAEVYRVLAGHRMAKKWEMCVKVRRDAEGLCGLGRAHQLAGEYDKAQKYYEEAIPLDTDSTMAKNLLAKLAEERETGVREKVAAPIAQHHTGEAGKSDLIPRAQLLNNEGVDELGNNNLEAAIAKFKEALSADPLCETARKNLSSALNNQGTKLEPEQGITYWRKALFVFPDNKTAQKNVASFVKYSGKNPDSFEDRSLLAESFAKDGDFVSAVVELREALAKKKDVVAQSKLKEYLKKAPEIPN